MARHPCSLPRKPSLVFGVWAFTCALFAISRIPYVSVFMAVFSGLAAIVLPLLMVIDRLPAETERR